MKPDQTGKRSKASGAGTPRRSSGLARPQTRPLPPRSGRVLVPISRDDVDARLIKLLEEADEVGRQGAKAAREVGMHTDGSAPRPDRARLLAELWETLPPYPVVRRPARRPRSRGGLYNMPSRIIGILVGVGAVLALLRLAGLL